LLTHAVEIATENFVVVPQRQIFMTFLSLNKYTMIIEITHTQLQAWETLEVPTEYWAVTHSTRGSDWVELHVASDVARLLPEQPVQGWEYGW
jgi:hypothetical protein